MQNRKHPNTVEHELAHTVGSNVSGMTMMYRSYLVPSPFYLLGILQGGAVAYVLARVHTKEATTTTALPKVEELVSIPTTSVRYYTNFYSVINIIIVVCVQQQTAADKQQQHIKFHPAQSSTRSNANFHSKTFRKLLYTYQVSVSSGLWPRVTSPTTYLPNRFYF